MRITLIIHMQFTVIPMINLKLLTVGGPLTVSFHGKNADVWK